MVVSMHNYKEVKGSEQKGFNEKDRLYHTGLYHTKT